MPKISDNQIHYVLVVAPSSPGENCTAYERVVVAAIKKNISSMMVSLSCGLFDLL
jgi:hypothetical protein